MSKQATELGEPVELQHIESLQALADIQWEIVDDDMRKVSRSKFLENEVTRLLRDNKTIKLIGNKGDKFYRWATANNLTLHRRVFPDFTIMWVTAKEKDASN